MHRLPARAAFIGALWGALSLGGGLPAWSSSAEGISDSIDATAAFSGSSINLSDLPGDGQKTYRLIRAGGPFPYEKDGVVFGNRERMLPRQPRGYYREYTVRTPGSHDRGARRIVCGGWQPKQPTACYYSDDHYSNFRQIVNSK